MANGNDESGQEEARGLRDDMPLPDGDSAQDLPRARPRGKKSPKLLFSKPPEVPEIILGKWHGVEQKDGSDQEKKESRWDWPFAFTISGLLTAVISAGFALFKAKTSATLTAIAFIPPFLFASFERYVNKLEVENNNTDKYYSDMSIWGYGMVIGVGLVVLYLFVRVVLSSIDKSSVGAFASALAATDSTLVVSTDATTTIADSTYSALVANSASVSSLALWHDGLLLFFLSAALAVVMYALVNVSRSEI